MTTLKYITLALLLVSTPATATTPDPTGAQFAYQCAQAQPECHALVDEMVSTMHDGETFCAQSPAVLEHTLEFIENVQEAEDVPARNLLTLVIVSAFTCPE